MNSKTEPPDGASRVDEKHAGTREDAGAAEKDGYHDGIAGSTSSGSSAESVDEEGYKLVYLEGSDTPVVVRPHNFFTRLLRTKLKPIPAERGYPCYHRWNVLSPLTWAWVFPLLKTGFNRILEPNDIFLVPETEKNARRMADYRRKLQEYKYGPKPVAYAEFWAMLYAVRWYFIMSLVMAALFVAGEIGMSLMSRTLIELVSDIYTGKTHHHGHATGFAIGSTIVQMSFQFFLVWNQYRTRALAEICRTMLISAVYDKITKLSPSGRQMYPPSKITSIITTDTNRIFMATRWTSMVLMFLPAFGGMLGVLIYNLGVSALPGAGLVLVGIVLNVLISRVITRLRMKSLPFADARIATVRETVENMRVIKFYGWETSFVKLVAKARGAEISYLKTLGMIEGIVDACLTSIPQFGGVLSFAVRIITRNDLPASLAFPSLTMFQLFVPLSMMFSAGITSHADGWASVKRLNDFFLAPEEPTYVVSDGVKAGVVKIAGGAFKWDVEAPKVVDRSWRRKLRWSEKNAVEDEAAGVAEEEVGTAIEAPVEAPANSDEAPAESESDGAKERIPGSGAGPDASASAAGDAIGRAGGRKFPGLHHIDLSIQPSELIMVTGAIGSGKSTLLNAIIGSVSKLSGSVEVGGRVSTVMTMWSQNATIRDNILFGQAYDAAKYARTVHACSLESDFANFAGRDFAEVGERGITLSGGQKARVALARCVYAGGDVVLLDDVLSAVDGRVANHIFTKCIQGVLRRATRVMVTHNVHLLEHADRVVYMDGSGQAHVGTLEELLRSEPGFARTFYEATSTDSPEASAEGELGANTAKTHTTTTSSGLGANTTKTTTTKNSSELGHPTKTEKGAPSARNPIAAEEAHLRELEHDAALAEKRARIENYDEDLEPYLSRVASHTSSISFGPLERHASRPDPAAVGAKLMQDEQRQRGTVKGEVLFHFLNSGSRIGIAFVAVILVVQAGVATAQVMQSVFLQFWTANRYHKPNGYYIGFYCLVVFSRAVCFVGMAVSVAAFCFNSSTKLHNQAVDTIYKAPMSYFDSTPLGRIINRFTDDTANLDTQLFMQLRMTLFSLSMLIASLVVIFVYIPYAIIALAPILVLAFVMLNFYRASARELKRINSLFRSSMFTLVTETISGISVIMSYGRTTQFASELDERIDNMNVSFQINLASQYWLSLRMAFSTLCVSLIVTLLSVYQVFNLNASKVGMLMSLLPSVSMSVVMLLPMLTELENQLNSVERLYELGFGLPQEAPSVIPENRPPESWPQRGAISIEQASLKYRDDLPVVLNNVSLKVRGGEKIGICGRTGAGKSTILSALFRLTELYAGRIVIDDVDISQIGLKDLRTKLAIIPQEPVLFQGTIRSNLDPFGEHSDAELWDALRRSGVIRSDETRADGAVSTEHRFHLDTKADSDGSNFSLGERQLLTLARALVRNAKIIVLDEATATVDFETDKMIQETIVQEFQECTIMCIAHRLQTIISYDRVLVMDAGEIAEVGAPYALFKDKTSVFSRMCAESGITERDFELSTE